MYLTKENDAKAFSEALIRAKLVDAPAGDRRVRELFNKTCLLYTSPSPRDRG